jgi:hypothetical protein
MAKQGPSNTWPVNGGYCDIVTDDFDTEFWRAYVGQSKSAAIRIEQHLAAHRNQWKNSLHYYFVAEGNGTRHMNFIFLWSVPLSFVQDKSARTSVVLLNNILETLMCYAFQSLPSASIKKFMDLDIRTIGLNVFPPLSMGFMLIQQDAMNIGMPLCILQILKFATF